ncbi:MAG: NADP-dependent oxidoreductase [Burkholderiaceae bacterium]|nr:NADP-dependent oxidoreductase [Burkholderiaceae bacterium]MCD8516932.1 NADP-dependent oxidoreductase [Burkholderiaceae bacterium]MCD8537549.1 NADP-dependent oxidoreductase [Burkholderiaceae bacterium]MCD8565640.1 NADP-dependent oxidoreductase [Burkholderiaceae bacterium]
MNQQIILVERPEGWVRPDHFKLVESPVPEAQEGEILVRNHWLSLDPYMRSRISAAKSYAQGVEPGQLMVGGTVGEVIESHSDRFKPGDMVLAATGWQLFAAVSAKQALKIEDDDVPPSAYLGVIGMPGITAWTGLMTICEPKAGETVVVDAASGAVGSVVGQLAKSVGCRVVGIAGGSAKCDFVVNELGFDACIDHKRSDFEKQLSAALPNGVDCLFENVGGAIFETLLPRMNVFSRIALCGMVSEFNRPPHAHHTLRSILINRIKLQGFIVSDHMETWPAIRQELRERVARGQIKFRESITQGLANAPSAFVGMLKGENFGKQLVRLID